MAISTLPKVKVVGSQITALPFEQQVRLITNFAKHQTSCAVFVANVHMLMEAHWNSYFSELLNEADLVTPDGMPLVWMMRFLGVRTQERVAGLELFIASCQNSSEQGIGVCLMGSTSDVLAAMSERLENDFPSLKIAATEPLPFRTLTDEEDFALIERINSSGAGLIFVALGCPKQEYWIAEHKNKIKGVMVGIGGAFEVYSGRKKWAPKWCREAGLEWFYRLIQDPKRLLKRYITTIPPFMYLALKQLFNELEIVRRIFSRSKI